MRGFRSFITESKQEEHSITPTSPHESLLDLHTRFTHQNDRAAIYGGQTHTVPDTHLEYGQFKVGSHAFIKGYHHPVDKDNYVERLSPSSSKDVTPKHKKFEVLSVHRVYPPVGSDYAGGTTSHAKLVAFVKSANGNHYAFEQHHEFGSGVWHTPEGKTHYGYDFHNHLREHEPGFFPVKPVNEKFFKIEPHTNGTHRIDVGKLSVEGTQQTHYDDIHVASRHSYNEAIGTINKLGTKYGHAPYKLKHFYKGVANRNVLHLHNGKDDAILLHTKLPGGGSRVLYTKHGQSNVFSYMNSAPAVFGAAK